MPDQYLYESPAKDIESYLWSLQIVITVTQGALLIFLHDLSA